EEPGGGGARCGCACGGGGVRRCCGCCCCRGGGFGVWSAGTSATFGFCPPLHSVSHTSKIACSRAGRPGLAAIIQPVKIRLISPCKVTSSTSTKASALGVSVGGRE